MPKNKTLGVFDSSSSWAWMANQSPLDLHSDDVDGAVVVISTSKPKTTVYDVNLPDKNTLIEKCQALGIGLLAFSPPGTKIEGSIPLENLHLALRNGRK